MADYQEYRRRVLHRRWRRRFMAAGLLFLLVLLGAVSVMWKRLHRDPAQTRQDTILQEITEDNTWNTLQYAPARSRCRRCLLAPRRRWTSAWRRCPAPPRWKKAGSHR